LHRARQRPLKEEAIMKMVQRLPRSGAALVLLVTFMLVAAFASGGIVPVKSVLKASEYARRIQTLSAIGTVHFRGVEGAGCWVFVVEETSSSAARVYELRGGGKELYQEGIRARVFGVIRNDIETPCGLPILVVKYFRILTPRPAYGVMLLMDRPTYAARVHQIGPGLEPTTDGPIRLVPAVLHGVLGVVNHTRQTVVLRFSSSQRFDFRILNCRGEVVWQWSEGKAFLTVMGEEQVGPRPVMYPVRVKLADREGNPLSPGTYTLEGWITHIPECRNAAEDPTQVERPVDELAGAVRFKILPVITEEPGDPGDSDDPGETAE
jgi:hypothetical protein